MPSAALAAAPPPADEIPLKNGTVILVSAEDDDSPVPSTADLADSQEVAQRAVEPSKDPVVEPYNKDREETGLTPISTVSPFNIDPEPGIMPAIVSAPHVPYTGRSWASCGFLWVAPANCYYPLYFQDVSLERYGHTYTVAQPFVSIGKFWCDFLTLPYHMGLEHPWDHQYPLGYYRPGDCVEPRCYIPLPSAEGATYETLIWAAAIAAIP